MKGFLRTLLIFSFTLASCTLTNMATSTPTSLPPPTQDLAPTPTDEPTGAPTAESTVTPAHISTPLPDGSSLSLYNSISIIGAPDFIDRTTQALALLEAKSPLAYRKIETYVSVIQSGQHSGMWAFEEAPRYEVGADTANASIEWYASTIAHDATHSELYHQYVELNGEPVPDDAWGGVDVERFCVAYQLEVLKQIGGAPHEIEYLSSQTGTHCDVDNDGDCDWDDYNNRNW